MTRKVSLEGIGESLKELESSRIGDVRLDVTYRMHMFRVYFKVFCMLLLTNMLL